MTSLKIPAAWMPCAGLAPFLAKEGVGGYKKRMTVFNRILLVLWPLCAAILPTIACGIAGIRKAAVWNPVEILLLWPSSVQSLFAYSWSYGLGSLAALAVCLFWWVRMPGFFYGALLFAASVMAGPTWVDVARLWHGLLV